MINNLFKLTIKSNWPPTSRIEVGIITAVYLIFILFMLVQHAMVFPYYDDWGLAVLDYRSVQNGFSGQDFRLSHVLNFLIDTYNDWSGRVFPIYLEIYLLKFGFWYVRTCQVLAILGALFCSVRIATDWNVLNKRPLLIWILPIILFIALPRSVLIGGIYWFAASTSYLWGSSILLFGAYVIAVEKKISIGSSLILSMAAVFNEQMGCAAIAFFISYIIYDIFWGQQKQRTVEKIYFLVPVILFASITIFAPGNFHRKMLSHYISDSFIEVVLSNVTSISHIIFAQESIFFLILMLSFFVLSFVSVKNNLIFTRNLSVIGIFFVVLFVSYILLPKIYFLICFIGLYSYVLLKSCRIYYSGIAVFSVFVASLGSLAPLIFAPETPARATIPFYILCFTPIIFSFTAIDGGWKRILTVTIGVIFILSMSNYKTVFNVYRENYETSTINHYQLMVTRYMVKNNIDIGNHIVLFKPSPEYAAVMPYRKPEIERWMKKYYEIPPHVIFDWHSKSTYVASNTTNREWINGVARDWATAFFVTYTPEAARDFAVGKKIILADESIHTVSRNQINGETLIVYLDGAPLDGKLVGYPKPITPCIQPK